MLKLVERWRRSGRVVIFHEFKRPPYGGGNQFLLALKAEWKRAGLDVGVNRVVASTQAVLFNSHHFDYDTLSRIDRSRVRLVHRVDGPIGVYRGSDDDIDRRIWQMNSALADATVFQSHYSLARHRTMGLEFTGPVVIPNAVDPTIFHPAPARHPDKKPLKVIASAWSDNPGKGAAVYQWLDEHLDRSRFSFTFVGRLGVPLRHSRLVSAVPSEALSDLLRDHDVYVAASEHDPCSNALVEALACGLPAIYRRSGGHPELVKDAGLGFDRPEEIPGLLDELSRHYDVYRSDIAVPAIAEVAQRYLSVLLPDARSVLDSSTTRERP